MPPIEAPTMCAADAQVIHQHHRVFRHVAQLVGRFQEALLEQFDRGQPLAAAHLARLADIAIVEADHPEATAGKLAAELVVPMDHLGAEPHDQQHRLGIGVAKHLVADVDAVHVGDLGCHFRCSPVVSR
jgi:hypothetical protein